MLFNSTNGMTLAKQIVWMDSPTKRSKGMLIYQEAPESLVAVFNLALNGFFPLIHCIGMRFPIDIVFCDQKKIVKHKYENITPNSLVLPWRSFFGGCPYLLEFSKCDLSQTNPGDQLSWPEKRAA